MKKLFFLMCTLFLSGSTFAQIEAPQPSPFARMEQKVGLTDITLEYSRPSMKGREIFGNLVPYGKVWRTGANANTTITFSDDVEIDGEVLKKGTYGIYTIPNKESWDVMFYSNATNWGNPETWDESMVALKATAEVIELPFEVQTFTIFFDDLQSDSAIMSFVWGNVEAHLKIEVPTEAKTMSSIKKVMNGPGANDYFAAASYYHESGKDLKQALEWIKKATSMQPEAYWMLRRKSLIEAELGMKKEAIATAKNSLAAAEKAMNADYVKMNKDSLKEWGAL
ncbi:DUF2911 domain-containing protein [Gillisia sp. M10.2A]|uniref:DUF2911 domain-containing protein n=1 Tax=Gillisia lutea TaxID=2909668 RepID=A0ABS9EH28_9FLAO|nr:DUF2911 domain-containing protein [Gillisia lutea]MCF4101454.1 DUF2911 domain-containing protein [Gillisia lutea]